MIIPWSPKTVFDTKTSVIAAVEKCRRLGRRKASANLVMHSDDWRQWLQVLSDQHHLLQLQGIFDLWHLSLPKSFLHWNCFLPLQLQPVCSKMRFIGFSATSCQSPTDCQTVTTFRRHQKHHSFVQHIVSCFYFKRVIYHLVFVVFP